MKNIASLISKVDFVGMQVKPTLRGSNRIKSVFGGMLTVIVSICIAFGFSYFGLSIIRKDRPIMNNVQKKTLEAATPLKKNPFMISVINTFGRMIHGDKGFSEAIEIQGILAIVRPNEQQSYDAKMYYGKFKMCEKSDLDEKVWNDILLTNRTAAIVMCLDQSSLVDSQGNKYGQEVVIRNRYSDVDSDTLLVRIKFCDESKNPGCRKYIEDTGRMTVVGYQMNYFVDQSDYDNPVKPDVSSVAFQITDKISQTANIYSKINEIETDKSLFLTETFSETYFTVDNITSSVGEFEPKRRIVFQFNVSNEKIISINQRRYLKIPELLANMGGFMKAAMLIANLLSFTYSEYVCFNSIRELEFKNRKSEIKTNNLMEKSTASIVQSKNLSIPKPKIGLSKSQKSALKDEVSYLSYLSSMFMSVKAVDKKKTFRYLELEYWIDNFLFIEEERRSKRQVQR